MCSIRFVYNNFDRCYCNPLNFHCVTSFLIVPIEKPFHNLFVFRNAKSPMRFFNVSMLIIWFSSFKGTITFKPVYVTLIGGFQRIIVKVFIVREFFCANKFCVRYLPLSKNVLVFCRITISSSFLVSQERQINTTSESKSRDRLIIFF